MRRRRATTRIQIRIRPVMPSVHPPRLPNPVVGIESDTAAVGAGGTGVESDEPDGLRGFLGFDVGSGSLVDAGVLVGDPGVLVGDSGVLVGETGVLVGDSGVLVGDSGVLVGNSVVAVDCGSLVGVGRGASVP